MRTESLAAIMRMIYFSLEDDVLVPNNAQQSDSALKAEVMFTGDFSKR